MKNTIETFTGSKDFRLSQVAEGVFAAISVPGTGSLGNAAIIDLGDTTLVVDAFTTIQTETARSQTFAGKETAQTHVGTETGGMV